MYLFKRQNQEVVSNFRINSLQAVIFLLVLCIISRLFYLQVLNHEKYRAIASQQHRTINVLQPERGEIFALVNNKADAELYPLAINQVYYEVYANPTEVSRPQNLADILSEVLDVDRELILGKLELTNDKYEAIKKQASEEEVKNLQVKLDNLLAEINKDKAEKDKVAGTGIYWDKQILRFYPDKEIGSNMLGFLGYADDGVTRVGKYGLEGYWEKDLAGLGGQLVADRDSTGRIIPFDFTREVSLENGADLVLTIDRNVQYQACKSLDKAIALYDAKGGSVIVMETATGAIRAMCNYPNFDPNKYNEVESIDTYNNLAVYHAYEPGSVMKAIAMAIALDTNKVSPDTLYEDKGEEKIAEFTIRNSDLKAHGLVNMTDVLVGSYNTGIIFATHEVNNKIFEDYMERFGFGKLTGIKISQETAGDISSLAKKGDIYKATASYGQGITVTPLQMVSAFNVIANRGQLVEPYLVSQVKHLNGEVEEFKPKVLRKVISENTASTLAAMLVQVVDNPAGHAQRAQVEGYYVAGKTGTAQVADPGTGRYATDRTIHSFVGFAPITNPKFTMITKLDYPTAARFAEATATPLFGEIAKFLLEYYQVPPDR